MSEQNNDGVRPGDWSAPQTGPDQWVPGAELPGFDMAVPGDGPSPASAPRADPYGDRSSSSAGGPAPTQDQRVPAERPADPAAPSAAIEQYQVRRSRGPLIAVIGLMAVILTTMAIFALRRPQQGRNEQSTPPPATSTAPSSPGPSTSTASAIPVESGSFSGTWQINSSNWDSTGLVVDMTITSTSGSLSFTMFTIDNVNTEQTKGTGEMASGTVGDGRTMQGQARFDKDRNDTTVVLADASGHQITALTVSA
ncbi:hypothetical protein [uncultured Propionibacterium sp.]|uniref:hypothetical protein n=1 Tax=uncultured Propionibacterium sp. TaxID=218066 RepID=UPI00293180AB|nr:hypothetical protein [uncultured Propionibacterium sp.]